jgi:hypothetical protein
MTAYVADAHALIQKFVSVAKVATVLEERTLEEQRSLVLFCGRKDVVRRYS